MNRARSVAWSTALVLSATTFAANVTTDYSHKVDFHNYHTFSFVKVQTADPFFDDRIKTRITTDLTNAGFQPVASGGDLSLTAFESDKTQQEYNTFYNGLGDGGWGWGGWGGWGGGYGQTTTTVQQVPIGTLMVDMYDSKTHQMVWRGRATGKLSDKTDKNTKKVDSDIDHMLHDFPPKTKS